MISGDVVRGHAALPDVHAHVDHKWHKVFAVRVGVVDDALDAVGFIISVDLLIRGQDEFFEHGRGDKGRCLAAPVVVMEQCVGLYILADLLGVRELIFGDHVDDLMHLVGVCIKGCEAVGDLQQIVALLEDAGRDKRRDEVFVPVDLPDLLDEGRPGLIGEDNIGGGDIISPVLDVLYDDMLRVMHGEGAGRIGREADGDAPSVFNGGAALDTWVSDCHAPG